MHFQLLLMGFSSWKQGELALSNQGSSQTAVCEPEYQDSEINHLFFPCILKNAIYAMQNLKARPQYLQLRQLTRSQMEFIVKSSLCNNFWMKMPLGSV